MDGLRSSAMLNLSAFREPRGVMRILQFIFCICAFATTTGFEGKVSLKACAKQGGQVQPISMPLEYPYSLDHIPAIHVKCNQPSAGGAPPAEGTFTLSGDFSSDAKFFVATGVLSLLYCVAIVAVYAFFEEKYQSNSMIPLSDFILTTILAVLWLSSSAAWANGLNGMKYATDSETIIRNTDICKNQDCADVFTTGFTSLNISIIFGFLNFFLWASDLWFLYKETHWFKMRQEGGTGGV